MPIQGKTVLAIIPARHGSRRVPLKNLTMYKGKALIQHAIDHARASRYIDRIIVSSDSEAILLYAEPPVIALRRPAYLATDHTKSESVIIHALYAQPTLSDSYTPAPLPDYFVLLQPTSPNRLASDIDACLELATQSSAGSCQSLNPQGMLNGAVYVAKPELFLASLSLTAAQRYVMPEDRSLDIDTTEDFQKYL